MKNKVTLNKDGTPRKQGSGRKKGATSFVNVTLDQLAEFCGNKTLVPVSRVWLESMGASIEAPKQEKIIAPKTQPETEQKIEFVLHK